jgi:hypothetical protein
LNSIASLAVLALDHVAAVAGIPLERVVSLAEEGDVVALVPSTKSSPSPPSRTSAPCSRSPRRPPSPAPWRRVEPFGDAEEVSVAADHHPAGLQAAHAPDQRP